MKLFFITLLSLLLVAVTIASLLFTPDGLLICSISDDSHDIYKLLDTFDGRTASLANSRNL